MAWHRLSTLQRSTNSLDMGRHSPSTSDQSRVGIARLLLSAALTAHGPAESCEQTQHSTSQT
eukprot:1692761-Rhodomonas_salina.2